MNKKRASQAVRIAELEQHIVKLYMIVEQIINKIKDKLEGKQSKLILYTYDAFVFDVCKDEKQYLYTEVFPLITGANQRYPIKITVGKNYDEL